MHTDLEHLVPALSAKFDADYIVYCGEICRPGYESISEICRNEKTRPNAVLMLSTFGGDPHAGYRIARAIGHHYDKFAVMIPGQCKSAGTLICLRAGELIMGDRSEFGPLDVQIRKKDELFELGSGLDTIQALNYMQAQAMNAFRTYLIELKSEAGLSTRMAAEIASKLTTGLFSPVYSQIDPVKLGELQRSVEVAYAYGERLSLKSKNLKPGALDRLVSKYPSHGFVIDRGEAKDLFVNVRPPLAEELELSQLWYTHSANKPGGPPLVISLTNAFKGNTQDDTATQSGTEGEQQLTDSADGSKSSISETSGDDDQEPRRDKGAITSHPE